jgi:hypothetical protein
MCDWVFSYGDGVSFPSVCSPTGLGYGAFVEAIKHRLQLGGFDLFVRWLTGYLFLRDAVPMP